MRKAFFLLVLLITLLFLTSPPLYSHSGRTDSSGGHRDTKNASGLGPYHYHHGMGPHLHPSGICPYESKPVSRKKDSKDVIVTVTFFGSMAFAAGVYIYKKYFE